MNLFFRPHHFLCTLGFQGKGYSPEFIKNYHRVMETLDSNEELPIQVVKGNDTICQACPHIREKGCIKEEKIQSLDNQHSRILSIKPGDTLTWKEAQLRLKDKMILKTFHQACKGCSWKEMGICEAALKKLQGSRG